MPDRRVVTPVPRDSERRRSPRLPLAIPVFVRGRDQQGTEFVEFSVMLNESAGGALLATRRRLRRARRIALEIPSAPLSLPAKFPQVVRKLRARILRITPLNGWNLCALIFSRPILPASEYAT